MSLSLEFKPSASVTIAEAASKAKISIVNMKDVAGYAKQAEAALKSRQEKRKAAAAKKQEAEKKAAKAEKKEKKEEAQTKEQEKKELDKVLTQKK